MNWDNSGVLSMSGVECELDGAKWMKYEKARVD